MSIERLSWDSQFFNRRIGRWQTNIIDFENIPNPEGFDLIYVETDLGIADKTKPKGWFDAGAKLTFTIATKPSQLENTIHRITQRTDELTELSWLSGHLSRYKLDPCFSEDEFKRLYTRWIDACLEGKWNAKILGIELEKKLAGFITVESNEDHARIGLIAVHPKNQGQGLSGKLISAARHEAHNNGHDELRVSTQDSNHSAIQAYLKVGFTQLTSIHQFHWWTEQ